MNSSKIPNYKVYKYTSPSNKVYIGITKTTRERREGKRGSGYKTCVKFYRAIQKYGIENFVYDILEDNLFPEDAFKKEIYYIDLYDSTNPMKGYNCSFGGDAPMLGRKHSEETLLKFKENNIKYWKGKHLYPTTKQKISQKAVARLAEKGNPMSGKHHSELTKSTISNKAKIRNKGKGNPNYGNIGELNSLSKSIYYICNGEMKNFIGIRQASRDMSIPEPNIIRSLKSNGKFSAGKINNIKIYWFYSLPYAEKLITGPLDKNLDK